MLQCVAVFCRALQSAAAYCTLLQRVAVWCSASKKQTRKPARWFIETPHVEACCSVLQRVAACCSVRQYATGTCIFDPKLQVIKCVVAHESCWWFIEYLLESTDAMTTHTSLTCVSHTCSASWVPFVIRRIRSRINRFHDDPFVADVCVTHM